MGNLFSKFFGTVGVIDSIRVTLVMSFWSTLIASMLGIFLGLVLEQTKFPGKKLVVRVNRTLMGAPPVVIGLLTYMLLRKILKKLTTILKKSKKYGIKLNYGGNEYGDKTANGFNITK